MPEGFDDWLSRSLAETLGSAGAETPPPRYRRSASRARRRHWVWWPASRAGFGALVLGSALVTGSFAAGFHAIDPSASLPILTGAGPSAHPSAAPSGVHGGSVSRRGSSSGHGRSGSAPGHSPAASPTPGHGHSGTAPGHSPAASPSPGHGRSGG